MNKRTRNMIIESVIIVITLLIVLLSIILRTNDKEKNANQRIQRNELEKKQDEELRKEKEKQQKLEEEKRNEQILIEHKKIEEEKNNYYNEINNKMKMEKEQFQIERNNLENKLKLLGYKREEKCYDVFYEDDICYSNNMYEFVIKNNSVSFAKNINVESLKNYDCTNDVKLIESFFNKSEIMNYSNLICSLINMIGNNNFSSFNIDLDGLYLFISNYSSNLKYNIDYSISYNYEMLYPSDINSIVNSKNNLYTKKEMFDLAVTNNKKYFKYYDFINTYFDKNNNIFCNINYKTNDGYIMKSSFCHGGTSNTYYKFNYNKYNNDNYDYIETDIKGINFRELYLNIINNDLEYFSKKLNTKIELNDYNKNLLTKYVSNNELDLSLDINDNITLDIKYYPEYYYQDYKLKYIIK